MKFIIFLQLEAKEILACVEAARPESDSKMKMLKKQIKFYSTAREFLIPMSIMLFLSIVQGASGVDTISYYALKIFRMAKISLDEYLMSIFLQVCKVGIIYTPIFSYFRKKSRQFREFCAGTSLT